MPEYNLENTVLKYISHQDDIHGLYIDKRI